MEEIFNDLKNDFSNYQITLLKKLIKYTKENKLLWGIKFNWDINIMVDRIPKNIIIFSLFAVINDEDNIYSNYIKAYNNIESTMKNNPIPKEILDINKLNYKELDNEIRDFFRIQDLKQDILKIIDDKFLVNIKFFVPDKYINHLKIVNNDNNPSHTEKFWLDAAIDSVDINNSKIKVLINPILSFSKHSFVSHKNNIDFILTEILPNTTHMNINIIDNKDNENEAIENITYELLNAIKQHLNENKA